MNINYSLIKAEKPVNIDDVYISTIKYNEDNLVINLINVKYKKVQNKNCIEIVDTLQQNYIEGLFNHFSSVLFENRKNWFNNENLTKEICEKILVFPYSIENDKMIFEFSEKFTPKIDSENITSCTFCIKNLLLYRSNVKFNIENIDYISNMCLIDEEDDDTQKNDEESNDIPEPDINIILEKKNDLEKKRNEIERLKMQSKQILQDYYTSKAKVLQKEKEIDILKNHYSS